MTLRTTVFCGIVWLSAAGVARAQSVDASDDVSFDASDATNAEDGADAAVDAIVATDLSATDASETLDAGVVADAGAATDAGATGEGGDARGADGAVGEVGEVGGDGGKVSTDGGGSDGAKGDAVGPDAGPLVRDDPGCSLASGAGAHGWLGLLAAGLAIVVVARRRRGR
jgi:hypothetical protein